ncbi:hypothetical protein [Geminocystis sp. NIES-3709]|uniref:hypothetical protein n=1 Tax=Geminocystis sp. NIES-3709 TaxID=1617448 RepID=UPI000826B14B|nr:hypothetical protein [Geminocystis sp. NIES-3709]
MVKIGDKVVVAHLKDDKGNTILEYGVVLGIRSEPLERIKVEFEGNRYPSPLWISPRLLQENQQNKESNDR